MSPAPRQRQFAISPLDYAYRLLARRAYSEQKLAEKMLSTGFTETAVARTVERLKEQGYLNDTLLAADQAERLHKQSLGRERIRVKLLQKGLAPDTIDDALAAEESPDELKKARRFLASRFSADALKQPKVAARACRLLVSRGYSPDVVEQLFGSGLDFNWRAEEE
ncbi:MAG: regulatory protein RecX [Candidatus Binatia bacterium]